MPDPIVIDIPHKAGRAGARAKIEQGFDQLIGIIPGGRVTEHRWEGDTLAFTVEALGQRVAARIDVLDDKVHALLDLPPTLALFASTIKAKLLESGTKLLR
jgi:hypothetical protein